MSISHWIASTDEDLFDEVKDAITALSRSRGDSDAYRLEMIRDARDLFTPGEWPGLIEYFTTALSKSSSSST